MMIILPFAMNISMGERTLHELGNPNGKTLQKADGLPSPERSGSPELNTRSSQWKRDCIAYASKEDAHQIDDWPEARNRKSEDVLVRYKDTRGNKGSRTGMDPHAWSDLPTDTDDEIADNATSPVWNRAHDLVFSPKSGTSKAELDISIQQLTTVVPRNLKTQSEVVNLHYFASDDHWETVALDVVSRKEAQISDAENEGAVFEAKLPTTVASSRNGLRYDCHALEGEKIPTLKTIPGRLSQKSLDEQASLKMSHRYYTSGVDSSRRRSIPSRKDPESGIEDNIKHCGRKRCERAEADYKSNVRISTTNEAGSVKELAESSTSDDSSCSDAEFDNSRHGDEDVDGSLREMILQKYLVMLPGKVMKMVRTSADTKQKEGRCKSQSPTEDPPCRKLNGKSLHSVSPSRGQRFQLRKSPKKNPCSSSEALRTRASVSQPAEALEANIFAAKGAPREEECQTRKSSPFVALLNKSWSTGDLYHSKSLGDIATLKGRPLTHRQMDKSMSEQEKRTVDVQLSSVKDSKAPRSDALQTLASAERSFAMEKTVVQHEETAYPQHTSEGLHNLTNFCIRSVEVSTTATADLPQTKVSDYGVSCGCLNSVLQGSSKTQLNTQLSSAMGEVEYQWQGHMTEQGGESVDGAEGSHCIRENPTAKEQVKLHSKGAEESSDGGSTHRSESKQANCGSGAEKGRNGFTKPRSFVKKVTAVIPFGSCGDDQVLPNVSLAGQPASHARLQLQHEVESSKHHVADERLQQVRNKKHSPPEQCWETEKLAQQKKGFWDASQELQKEKQNLLKRLQAHHPCNRLKAMSGTKVQLTEEDAKKLRQEILEQEALIRGYQVENEKAVAKLREFQLEAKQKLQEMAEEKAHLASQLVNRQMLGYGTDSTSLHEKLQGALSRETTLRIDLDEIRDSYLDLEKRVTREESSRVKDLELKLKSLQETLGAERQSNSQMEGRKQAMIQQEELIASLQETISDQASNIRSLTSRLEAGEGQEKKDFQKQIETLQNQVKRLEASLRASKKDTGLHAVQMAKSGMEENEAFRRMQTELMAAQRNALQREEETSRIIHHLKIEKDKMKHESATRIRNLNHHIQAQARSGHTVTESEQSALNRVKELEKQMANLRIHYSRRVKELTDKLDDTKPVETIGRSKTQPDNAGAPSRAAAPRQLPGKALREAKERIALQEDVLSQKNRTIKSLQKQIQAFETTGAGPTAVAAIEGDPRAKAAAAREVPCSTSPRQQGSPRQGRTRPPPGSHGALRDAASAGEVAVLRKALEKSELKWEVLQRTCDESVEKTVLLTLQHQQALQLQEIRQSQMNHPRPSECQPALAGAHPSAFAGWGGDHRTGAEGMNWLSEPSSLEMTNRALEARLKVMSEELEEANSMCQQSPRMTQILHLKKKVAEMESRQHRREMEWQMILQETKQTSSREHEYAERKWQEALTSKNMEVEKIRVELNTILEAAMAMQQAQLHMTHRI